MVPHFAIKELSGFTEPPLMRDADDYPIMPDTAHNVYGVEVLSSSATAANRWRSGTPLRLEVAFSLNRIYRVDRWSYGKILVDFTLERKGGGSLARAFKIWDGSEVPDSFAFLASAEWPVAGFATGDASGDMIFTFTPSIVVRPAGAFGDTLDRFAVAKETRYLTIAAPRTGD